MARNFSNISDLAAEVAEEALPGWTAIQETPLDAPQPEIATPHADAWPDDASDAAGEFVMPSTETLKAKYLGAAQADTPLANNAGADDAADTTLVEMEAGPLRKTVAISKSKKKVLWSQG